MDRIFFENQNDCFNFFEEYRKKLGMESWKSLATVIGTNRSMLDKYRRGRLCIPEDRFFTLLNQLGNERRRYFLSKVNRRNENWGRILGGKKAYLLNRKSFDLGRKIAKKIREETVKYNFDVNMPLSEELCEFIGVIIGDGFTNEYNRHYQTQITGDRKLDYDYYNERLIEICKILFSISPKVKERDNVIRIDIFSKNLFEMLTKRFMIPKGKKCYTVTIPSEIIITHENLLNSTIRGMFNTDGGVGFDKRKTYKKPYVRINYTSTSEKLINQIHIILDSYNIKHSIHKKDKLAYMIQINGERNVKKFLLKIGFSNNRHLNKLKYLI